MKRVMVLRLDSDGDVLLAGPAVRAVAAQAKVLFVCGPRGRKAAELLPGVAELASFSAPWIDPDPAPVTRSGMLEFVEAVAAWGVDEAVILTSFHQSALPTALLLAWPACRWSLLFLRTIPARCSTCGTGSTVNARGRARAVAGCHAGLPVARRRRRPAPGAAGGRAAAVRRAVRRGASDGFGALLARGALIATPNSSTPWSTTAGASR
jgi:hypothetical protein